MVEKLGGSRKAKSGSYNTNKSIIHCYSNTGAGSESGKMAANLRRGSESGGGGHAFEYDKQTKVHFVSEHYLLSC
jgi:hypothetical protein